MDTATQTKGSDIMTQDHVAGFASELVKMAQAMERVPHLEAELAEWQRKVSACTDRIIELELLLESRTTYAASLEAKVHDAEVARDDAELRFLEADDAKDTLVRVLDGLGKDILGALQAVAPVTAAPTEVSPKVMEAVSVDAPLVNDGPFNGVVGQSADNPTQEQPVGSPGTTGEGVSVPAHPTSSSSAVTGTGTEKASSSNPETPRPFDPTPASPDDVSSPGDAKAKANPYYDYDDRDPSPF